MKAWGKCLGKLEVLTVVIMKCRAFSEAKPCRLVRKRRVQWPEILKHNREVVGRCRNSLHIDMGS